MLLGVCIVLLSVSVVVARQLPARRADVPEFVRRGARAVT